MEFFQSFWELIVNRWYSFWINLSFIGVGTADQSRVPSIAVLPFINKGASEDEFYSYEYPLT